METALKKNRPSLSPSSIKTYVSILRSLHKHTGGEGEATPDYFIKNQKRILDHLQTIPYNRRKTILAALVSLCGDNGCVDHFRTLMLKDIKEYTQEQKKQELTTEEKSNWMTQEEIKKVYDETAQSTKYLLRKTNLTNKEQQRLMDFIILSVYTMIEPRRIMDYTRFKVRNIDPKTDNYMKGLTFVFNQYKTQKVYGQQVVKIPRSLYLIIRKWTERNGGRDWLLYGDTGNPFNQSQLTMRLNRIFGKKVSVNILRKSFLTHRYANMPRILEMEQTASDMGNSPQAILNYYVKPDQKN